MGIITWLSVFVNVNSCFSELNAVTKNVENQYGGFWFYHQRWYAGKMRYFGNIIALDTLKLRNTGHCCGPGSSVSIATGYGLDGPGIESPAGARFSAPVQTGLGNHPASCTMGNGFLPGGKERPGRDADPSPPSSAVGHERVELYLYSPYGPYGLYRASLPVEGCTLLLLDTVIWRSCK